MTLVYVNSASVNPKAPADAPWVKLADGLEGGVLWGAAAWPPAPSSLVGQLLATRGGLVLDAFRATLAPANLRPAAVMLLAFVAVQLALMRLMPGAVHRGPVSPSGHVPVYKANGPQSFFFALSAYVLLVHGLKLASALEVLRLYPTMVAIMSFASFALVVALYAKGLLAPSGADHGSSGNPIMDLFWGTELYPRILGWDVKIFTNCRFGMMSWALLPVAFLGATLEAGAPLNLAQAVNCALQLVYVAKFFDWEMGYTHTIDVQHDRAGYYICWGCLVWVPSVYVVHSHHLAHQVLAAVWAGQPQAAPTFSPLQAAACLLAGLAMVWWNYDCDLQKSFVRAHDGKCTVWGAPARTIVATYVTEGGERRTNKLLVSGWWGVSRHIHYVPEILAAAFWTLPCALEGHLAPWFYVLFLVILLTDRAFRDDARCAAKYGKAWDQYCRLVPYKIIPYVI